ncbi:MAG: hypothetical protein LBF69_05385 [Prevotellaceae bacterium]|jgi:hypothetical protein|nr:hypothetical protein [Prevotellaceae bacterium]
MAEGVIDSLFDKQKVGEEVKSIEAMLIGLSDEIKKTLTEIARVYKEELKTISDFDFKGLKDAVSKINSETQKMTTLQQQQETLNKRLTDARNAEAVAIEKVRLQLAEQNRENKIAAQQQVANEKVANGYIYALKNQANSIKELTEQNKKLRQMRDSMDTETQTAEIRQLNAMIDTNTTVIKLNEDAYVRQKMNIGNYQKTLGGLKQELLDISEDMKFVADNVGKQSKEYKDLQAQADAVTAKIDDLRNEMQAAAKDVEPMQTQLKKLKQEAQELYLVIKEGTATEEMKARFHEVTEEAAELQKKIQGVSARIDMMASNTAGIQAVVDGIGVVNAGFEVYKGVLTEAGIETEALDAVMTKLSAAIAVANGLQTLSNALKQKSALITMLESAATSKNIIVQKAAIITQRALNAAQKAMPILAVIAGLALLVGWLVKFAKSSNDTAKRQKEFNEALGETTKATAEHASKIQIYINTMNNVNATVYQQQEAFQGLNKELANTGLQFDTIEQQMEWFLKNGEDYNKMLAQQASMQAHINNHTKASVALEELMNKRGKRTGKEMKQIEELKKTMEAAAAGIQSWGELYYSSLEKLGIKTKEQISIVQKVADLRIAAMKDGQTKELAALKNAQEKEEKEVTGTAEQIAEQKKLIEQKYVIEREKINKKYNEQTITLERQLAGLRIEAMNEGYQKEFKTLVENEKKEKDTILNNAQLTAKQKGELINSITDKHNKLLSDLEKKYAKERTQIEIDTLNMIAKVAEVGSERRLTTQVSALEKQRELEKKEATKKGEELGMTEEEIQRNIAAIDKKYDKEKLDAFTEFINAKVAKAQEEVGERARIAQEAAAAEEAVLLEKYKSGEIKEKEYNKGIADIRHKYAVDAFDDEIAAIQKILDMEGISAEQRKEIEKKLYDAKKSLSDEETSHEIENIKRVEENRKKAAKMAQDAAKQAFDMAMDFLTQQSEAKVAELDAELERIDELMEKQLEELDNAVMSDETRAAEEKRIRAQAKADSDKIEAEKRKEQQKQAIYQKTSSTVQAIINTAQAITAALTIPPPAGPILAGINAALGAAQIAMIVAQPVAKYAKGIFGDEEHPGGYAVVGDARKREYVLTPSGKLYETPAVPTLVDMEKGAQVFPDYQTMMKYFRPEVPRYTTSTTAPDLSGGIDRLERAIKNVKPVQQVQMNLDNNGIWHVANGKSGRRRHINSFIHGNA